MAKIILTIEEAQTLLATKMDYFPQLEDNPEVTIEIPKVETQQVDRPFFPQVSDFIKVWQNNARSDNKIQIIKEYREWQTRCGFTQSCLYDAKLFVESVFYRVTI